MMMSQSLAPQGALADRPRIIGLRQKPYNCESLHPSGARSFLEFGPARKAKDPATGSISSLIP